jgi:hypothetical protein
MSRQVQELQRSVDALLQQAHKANLSVVDAVLSSEVDATPMLGHTKGNTKSNRKKMLRSHITLVSASVHEGERTDVDSTADENKAETGTTVEGKGLRAVHIDSDA